MGPGIVHNDIFRVGLNHPESQREFGQILADVAAKRPFCQKGASLVNGLLNAIGSIYTITRDVIPDFKEVVRRLRSEAIEIHPRCCASHSRLRASRRART